MCFWLFSNDKTMAESVNGQHNQMAQSCWMDKRSWFGNEKRKPKKK